MLNYYDILGLRYGADIAEIKAAFRQLAKLYHPDLNPAGLEHFSKILKAYETLSDPALRSAYDYKLNYHQAQTQQQTKPGPATKTWKFDERELKRRQYYNDYIKKYAKETSEYIADAETKKSYNEFKYILFATPLAVLLFLLIMHLATRDREELIGASPAATTVSANTAEATFVSSPPAAFKTGDDPYALVFGPARYEAQGGQSLTVANASGRDAVLCLFTATEFVRCVYVEQGTAAELSQLPAAPLYVRYCSGSGFAASATLKEVRVKGGFTAQAAYYLSQAALHPGKTPTLTLQPLPGAGFERIAEKEFFKNANTPL